jgi:hypothetical protein
MRSCLRLGFGFALTAWAWWVGDPSASLAGVVRSYPRTGKLARITVIRNRSRMEDAVDRIAARRFGVADGFDPVENLQGGAKYLKLNLYHGDYSLILAAYNAGEQPVARYGGVPPLPETHKYVVQAGKQFERTLKSENKSQKPAGKPAAAPDGAGPIQEVILPDGSVRHVLREPL